MHDIFKHLIIFIVILRNNQTHIVVLFLMSSVKYHAEMAVGQDTIVKARGEIRWLIYIDAL